MTDHPIIIGFSVAAFALSLIALIIGCVSLAITVGLKNSTHRIQYVPLDNPFDEEGKDKTKPNSFTEAVDEIFEEELLGGDWSNAPSRLRSKK